jgi:hypothetical protein
MDLISRVLILGVALLAAVLLFTPYEPFLEGVVAGGMVVAVLVGFLMYPRREVFYVRTSVRLMDPDRNQALEHDFLAVKVELRGYGCCLCPHLWRLPFSYSSRLVVP